MELMDVLWGLGGVALGGFLLYEFWHDKSNFWERRHGGYWFKWQQRKGARRVGRILGLIFSGMILLGGVLALLGLMEVG
ncbi:MAG: hypothetical protein FWG68_00310 [Defluviitaleaceae bacterium]|nr:hypothetical protein [Defluviitaleaceae bacterium]